MVRSSGLRSIVVGLSGLTLVAATPVSASEPIALEAGELDRVTAAGAAASASGRWAEVIDRDVAPTLGAFDLTDRRRERTIALLIPAVQQAREAPRGSRQQVPINFSFRLGTTGTLSDTFFYSHAYTSSNSDPF